MLMAAPMTLPCSALSSDTAGTRASASEFTTETAVAAFRRSTPVADRAGNDSHVAVRNFQSELAALIRAHSRGLPQDRHHRIREWLSGSGARDAPRDLAGLCKGVGAEKCQQHQ